MGNVRRSDDVPERVQQRFQRHFDNITALRQFYTDKCLIRIDGAQSPDDVLHQAYLEISGAERMQTRDKEKEDQSKQVGNAKDSLGLAEKRLNAAWKSLLAFKEEVALHSNWCAKDSLQRCGCQTRAKTYVGVDPPALWA